MSSLPPNTLVIVKELAESNLAYLQNYLVFAKQANMEFDGFNEGTANLGDTVRYDKPFRIVTQDTLNVADTFQPTNQRFQELTVNQPTSAPVAYTAEQIIFNVEKYKHSIMKAMAIAMGNTIDIKASKVCETQPYRFFGDGVQPIASVNQLLSMLAQFRNYGFANMDVKGTLADIAIPAITTGMTNQFAPVRNDKMVNSWELGNWEGVEWYKSNHLPLHLSGSIGVNQTTLTLTGTNDPSGNNITALTFAGAGAGDTVNLYDNLQFLLNVPFIRNYFFLQFQGYEVSSNPVQLQAVAPAVADGGGNITIQIYPPLCSTVGNSERNLQFNLTPGMQAKLLPNHRCGLLHSGNAFYMAMPKLPDASPWSETSQNLEGSPVSARLYYGMVPFSNTYGWVMDAIQGQTLPNEYAFKIVFPENQMA